MRQGLDAADGVGYKVGTRSKTMTLREAEQTITDEMWATNDLHSILVAHEALLVRLGMSEAEADAEARLLQRAVDRADEAIRAGMRARMVAAMYRGMV